MSQQKTSNYGVALILLFVLGIPVSCSYGMVRDAFKPIPRPKIVAPVVDNTPYVVPKDVVIRNYDQTEPSHLSLPSESTNLSAYEGSGSETTYRYEDDSPKTVYVRGYTRKDGTYVSAHTRRAPRRH